MFVTKKRSILTVFILFSINNCTTTIMETSEQKAIALCSAGYKKDMGLKVRGAYEKLGGELIMGGEVSEGGGLLDTQNVKDENFVKYYNAYVECINKRMDKQERKVINKTQNITGSTTGDVIQN